jgi:hypothetical protein
MYDTKPAAPIEFRGPFHAIPTNIGGREICELMPQQAKMMDRKSLRIRWPLL